MAGCHKLSFSRWVAKSIATLPKIYKRLVFLLIPLYLLGWLRWILGVYPPNKILEVVLLFILLYLDACLLYRCVRCTRVQCDGAQYVSLRKYLSYLLVEIIVLVLFLVGLVLFFVPGFYIALKLAFARLLILEPNQNTWTALKRSFHLTSGNMAPLSFLIIPVFLRWMIGRISANSLLQIPIGSLDAPTIIFNAVLSSVTCFYLLPFICVALALAYDYLLWAADDEQKASHLVNAG